MWKAVKKQLKVVVPKGHRVITPTEEEFDQFEASFKFKLPTSYRSFLLEIGAGVLGEYFVIDSPLPGIKKRIREEQGNALLAEIYGDKAFVGRMIPFGDTIAGDILAWDPLDVKGKTSIEYPIFVLPRDRDQIVRCADTFKAFIQNTCLGHGFEDLIFGQRDPEGGLPRVFKPMTKRSRTS